MQIRTFHTAPDNPITENYIDHTTGELYEADSRHLCQDCTTPAIDVDTDGAVALHLVHDPGCPSAFLSSTHARETEVSQ